MSHTIKLGRVIDPDNKISKTFNQVRSMSFVMKSDTSILTPTLTLNASINTLKGCNYAEIDDFGRKYFITDIRSLANNMVEVSLRVDVLSTYAQEILNNTAILLKSQTKWNAYLDDGGILKLGYDQQSITKFPQGFHDPCYILLVAGGGGQ